ncbi:vitamin K epoxide reductase family protein [Flavobacterium sp. UW10123]|uniref:vitamin K epoxide reductase family protein n=1 Tax=Flavobacterium sp. UW10123 TaxID=3230800 RepID=UPI0033943C57
MNASIKILIEKMNNELNYLFQYLNKENINIDKDEFLFQNQSHPDYPSLLSIADTLSFFNIENAVIRVEASNIKLLPNHFVAFLSKEMNKPQLYFFERKDNTFFYHKDKKTLAISESELESRWNGIVLLLEKPENVEVLKSNKNSVWLALQIFAFVLFMLGLYQFEINFSTKFFVVFPIIGILFSVVALKDLFGAKSTLLNGFCNETASTSCTTVVDSTKWKIFEVVNFSDLSIVFFVSQFFGLLVFLFSDDATDYFTIQKILLLASIPVLFLSVYYQKFVEKKWCPICIAIISIILLELSYLTVFQNIVFAVLTKSVLVFGFIFLFINLIWSALKKLLTKQKELKEYQLKAIRFERNYDIFKNSLLAKGKIQLPQNHIILGNKESKTIITVISSPFCGHCKGAHKLMEAILEKHHNDLQIQVILKANIETESKDNKKLFRSLMKIYEQNGEFDFIKALNNWFEIKKILEWFSLFPISTTAEFDGIFTSLYKWCEENEYNFTPTIFVNGFEYPKTYNRESLEFFINDLIEDEF